MKSVSIIGSGNVGWHLAHQFILKGISVEAVFSREKSKAAALAKSVSATPINDLIALPKSSDLYIVAVKDDAIKNICQQVDELLNNKLIAHTSGAVNLVCDLSKNTSGVFYPLQTFTKEKKLSFKNLPILVESSNSEGEQKLFDFAQELTGNAHKISSDERSFLHVAAVFACNFSNYMFSIADDVLSSKKLKFELLMPLLEETVNKLHHLSPEDAQTGPAKRGDFQTIDKHLSQLPKVEQRELYKSISNHIFEKYNPK